MRFPVIFLRLSPRVNSFVMCSAGVVASADSGDSLPNYRQVIERVTGIAMPLVGLRF
jgi:hypothetical protein